MAEVLGLTLTRHLKASGKCICIPCGKCSCCFAKCFHFALFAVSTFTSFYIRWCNVSSYREVSVPLKADETEYFGILFTCGKCVRFALFVVSIHVFRSACAGAMLSYLR